MCYTNFVAASPAGKEAKRMAEISVTFIISVLAGVVACYIYKWLDGE